MDNFVKYFFIFYLFTTYDPDLLHMQVDLFFTFMKNT